ncbi:MAG: DUF1800 family protein [Pseudomonadota bacterium]
MSLMGALAATRFGLGAKDGDIQSASADPEGWLHAQLVQMAGKDFPDAPLKSSQAHMTDAFAYIQHKRAQTADEAVERAFRDSARQTTIAEITARTSYATTTENAFHERLVRFWSNHFTVAATSPQTRLVVGAYEREAIRPNILGRFTDLAQTAIFHPGMLIYLNNAQSVGPNSRAGKRRGRGLNENLAREVMELHTVTPASGYTQADVTAFAKALTGWLVGNHRIERNRIGRSVFSDLLHEPGRQTILGKRYSDTGGEQAKSIVEDLCASPHTAKNIAYKLARHFIADVPPESLVDKLSASFLETGGDLKALYTTLIQSDEAWTAEPRKVKTPDELIISTGRLLGLKRVLAGDARRVFESFAQIPFTAPSPEGWPDDAAAWTGPDALMKRIEWANRIGEQNSTLDARQLLDAALGARASNAAIQAVMRAESPSQAIALALMSPDFQMR